MSEVEAAIEGFDCANTPENESKFLEKKWDFKSGSPSPELLGDWLENDSMPPECHREYGLFAL